MKLKNQCTITYPSGGAIVIPTDTNKPILSTFIAEQPVYDLPITIVEQTTFKKRNADFTPRYQHYCDNCIFLAKFNEYDLYFCPQGGDPTVIARFGTDGDYLSGITNIRFNDARCPLWMALYIAKAKHLI